MNAYAKNGNVGKMSEKESPLLTSPPTGGGICEIGGILGGLGKLGGLRALGILGGLGIPNHNFLIVFDAFTKRSD